MKRKELNIPARERPQAGDTRQSGSGLERAKRTDESRGLFEELRVLGLLEENQHAQHELVAPGDTASARKITRMPEGIEVVEHRTGVAEGQWLLQVRCQCGRRWFEIEAVPASTCPRCGLLVFVHVSRPKPSA